MEPKLFDHAIEVNKARIKLRKDQSMKKLATRFSSVPSMMTKSQKGDLLLTNESHKCPKY
jgi:hypothetical protein